MTEPLIGRIKLGAVTTCTAANQTWDECLISSTSTHDEDIR